MLDVALEEDVAALDEVVVVGFGTQKKASVVGSITNIEPAKLAAAPSRSGCPFLLDTLDEVRILH